MNTNRTRPLIVTPRHRDNRDYAAALVFGILTLLVLLPALFA